MALNYIWIGFFLVAFVVGLVKLIFFGDAEVFPNMMQSTFDMAKTGFEISIYLTGILCLWLGIMKIGEKGGAVNVLGRVFTPFFTRIFPGLPKNHPAYRSIIMNMAMNMLCLDNAATPIGLKAMKEMQEVNDKKDTASNAQIMFLVLNTSAVTVIPITIMMYRAQAGAKNPADVFIPLLIATFFSTFAGLVSVSIVQKINLFNRVILTYLAVIIAFISGLIWLFHSLPQEQVQPVSNVMSAIFLLGIIVAFIIMAMLKKVNIYECFIEGAKEGFSIAVKIIPYLVAMLVGIGLFRVSGALVYLNSGVEWFFALLGVNTDFVPALPTAYLKPLSGSGARSMMVEIMKFHGADSFVGRLTSLFQGSTETTFYVIAVYFGSVGIRKTRHAVTCGLIADLAGIIAAIFVGYLFFAGS
jgi:spore maturation protein SpmA